MNTLPSGWLALDGSTYDEVDYPELYARLDGVFKNEIAETFTLPDCDGVSISGSGVAMDLGDTGGSDSVTLSIAELPSHSHSYIPVTLDIDIKTVGAPNISAGAPGAPIQTGLTGSGDAHENRPPYLTLVMGVYSGRL
jgi:microcystin-dependent protein